MICFDSGKFAPVFTTATTETRS